MAGAHDLKAKALATGADIGALSHRNSLVAAWRLRGSAQAGDAAVATLLVIAGGMACWAFAIPLFFANLLILGAPSAYLLARSAGTRAMIRPRFVARYAVFVVVFVDYLCVKYEAWDNASLLPSLPGAVTVEQAVCLTLLIVFVLAINERFFATDEPGTPRRIGRSCLISMFVAGILIALIPPLQAPFQDLTYLWIGLVLYPPVIVLGIAVNPRIVRELVLITVVVAPVILGFELLALHHDYWVFEGEYIGEVTVAGLSFPTEELLFFVVLAAPAVVAAYAIYKNWKGMARLESVDSPTARHASTRPSR